MKGNGKRNYNEKNDVTEEMKLTYKVDHAPILEYTKIAQSALGGRDLFESENFEEADGRKGDILYKFTTLIYAALVSCCVGVSVVHKTASEFLFPDAIANLRYLTGDDLDMWPNYQTIGDAFGKADKSVLSKFEKVSQKCFRKLIHSGRYHARTAWGYHVVLDGTDIAFFTEKHCDHCLTATYDKGTKNEKTFYFHKMLVARAYIAPGLSVVIGAEPISNMGSDTSKQDCENKAAIKLLKRIKASFPEMHFLIGGDALYANKTFIRLCICNHWNYLFTVKRGAQPTLCDEFDRFRELGLLDSAEISYDKETGTAHWSNEMEVILGSDLPMNILQYKTEKPIRKGKKRAASKEFTHREYQMDIFPL